MNQQNRTYNHEEKEKEWERLTRQFDRDWKWEKPALADLGIIPGSFDKILVYGCGVGRDAFTFYDEGYGKYVEGWDIDKEAIGEATRRYATDNLVFHHLSQENIDSVKGAKFDVIVLRLVLLHIPTRYIHDVLSTCKEHLVNGGLLVIHDTNKPDYHVFPPDHPFVPLSNTISDYVIANDCSPRMGIEAEQYLNNVGLNVIGSKTIHYTMNHTEACDEMLFVTHLNNSVHKELIFLMKQLYDEARKAGRQDFAYTSTRIITVARSTNKFESINS